MTVAVLGLGEAGSALAADLLAAGVAVRGWDPAVEPDLAGLQFAADNPDAAAGADVALSVNLASVAVAVAAEVAPALAPDAIFADLNTAAPALKLAAAEQVEGAGARFADVALMAPVLPRGLGTPALASGGGAAAFVAAMAPLGMAVEALGEVAGEAAERKLLRSVFFKGMSIAVLESLEAARAAGCEEWLRGQIVATLAEAGEGTLERWLSGNRAHASRRAVEMAASAEMLAALGTPAPISAAAAEWYEQLAAEAAGAR